MALITQDHINELLAAPAVVDELLARVAGGSTAEEVCEALGLPLAQFNAWVRAVPERVAALALANASREEWLRQRIQREWSDVSFCDIRDIFQRDGETLRPMAEWPRGISKALTSIQIDDLFAAEAEGGSRAVVGKIKKFKLLDKLKATELLAKNLGMLDQRVQVSGTITLEHALSDSWVVKPANGEIENSQAPRILDEGNSASKLDPGFSRKDPPAEKREGADSEDLL